MLIKNIGESRFISSPTHDFYSADIATGEEVEVPDALGKSLCEQETWERVKTTAKAADKGEK